MRRQLGDAVPHAVVEEVDDRVEGAGFLFASNLNLAEVEVESEPQQARLRHPQDADTDRVVFGTGNRQENADGISILGDELDLGDFDLPAHEHQ